MPELELLKKMRANCYLNFFKLSLCIAVTSFNYFDPHAEFYVILSLTFNTKSARTKKQAWCLNRAEWEELCSCDGDLRQRKGGVISWDGCCCFPLRLAPPALAGAILVRLQDSWLIEACAHPSLTCVVRLIDTAASAVLSVMKGHLQSLVGGNRIDVETA